MRRLFEDMTVFHVDFQLDERHRNLEVNHFVIEQFAFHYDDPDLYAARNSIYTVNIAATEAAPSDPLFSNQWYLQNSTAGELDLNVVDVWDDYTGLGVQVNVIDQGSDYDHPDLAANYLSNLDYDYTSNDDDPAAPNGENHGTAVMGIVAAVGNNGEGGVGVAYGANLVNYRGFGIGASYGDEELLDAAGLGDGIDNTNGNANGSDVISMSGGLGSNVFRTNSNYDDAIVALETITSDGRGGLGTIFVKSSGNSRAAPGSSSREEGTAERYDSTEYSINAAALRADGWVTDYSTPGANVLIGAFADNTNNNGAIFTTDRVGTPGYSATDYTSGFSGTSAAAPQIAGIVALMLEANPDLGWRDVQKILAYSARHVGSDVETAANTGAAGNGGHEQATQDDGSSWFWNAADNWNGGSLHVSNDYGYGLADALSAVRLAESWNTQLTTANRQTTFEDDFGAEVTLDDATQTFIISETDNVLIEHVSIELDFQITALAHMDLYLISPEGTRVQLIADTGDSGSYNGVWRFGAVSFIGEFSAGDWQLEVVDDTPGQELTIRDIHLRTAGSEVTDDDTFIFTNEFSDYAGTSTHATDFSGGAGNNTLNAAAVSSATTINLATGAGTIDGVGITLSNIHTLYTGDGEDSLTGSSADETFFGGRGVDTIDGAGGIDVAVYLGNQADYNVLDNGDGTFSVSGGIDGDDTLTGIEILRFADGDVSLSGDIAGGSGDDILNGTTGNDTILGLAGNDILNGGLGADTLDGGDDYDFASYENATERVWVDLQGAVAHRGEAVGDTLIDIEGLIGSDWSDQLRGDAGDNTLYGGSRSDRLYGRAGDDVINGEGGADAIYGNRGVDVMTGGMDSLRDRFIYFRLNDTDVGAGNRDIITDFTSSEDRIEVSRIDADSTVAGNQMFDFIGLSAFSGTAGELRYAKSAANNFTLIQADVDGDGIKDFEIELTGVMDLLATDFLL